MLFSYDVITLDSSNDDDADVDMTAEPPANSQTSIERIPEVLDSVGHSGTSDTLKTHSGNSKNLRR